MRPGKIDGDRHGVDAFRDELRKLFAYLLVHEPVQLRDQPVFLEYLYEKLRRDRAFPGMVPVGKGFRPHDLIGAYVVFRLVIGLEFSFQ